ncbi:hypothetical protein [Flavobacteriaceae bacterium 14752]|uniref:hypothetical protein n=1 Tax=Mesohalobacter salilacus TaxID=2491711 RepID=UPI000F644273|nr:hypothetical protein EIG84_00985 [Flavobacteriaceae bacterium 14752]
MSGNNLLQTLHQFFISEQSRVKVEKFILYLALLSFAVHLILIFLVKLNFTEFLSESELLKNPISAIYTPFSFILIYEVYLLIFYLPKSFTNYVTKQYEIITLIIVRRLFKDLAALEITSDWFKIKEDLFFTYDLIASLVLFFLIFLFQKYGKQKFEQEVDFTEKIQRFIQRKKTIAVFLVPLFLIMATYTLINWAAGISVAKSELPSFETINNLFFDHFFTVLILVDVLLLLFSFFYTDQFHKIIRNSGFIISTILIRISFGVTGLINTALIVTAVLFGLLIIIIHNKFEKNIKASETKV